MELPSSSSTSTSPTCDTDTSSDVSGSMASDPSSAKLMRVIQQLRAMQLQFERSGCCSPNTKERDLGDDAENCEVNKGSPIVDLTDSPVKTTPAMRLRNYLNGVKPNQHHANQLEGERSADQVKRDDSPKNPYTLPEHVAWWVMYCVSFRFGLPTSYSHIFWWPWCITRLAL